MSPGARQSPAELCLGLGERVRSWGSGCGHLLGLVFGQLRRKFDIPGRHGDPEMAVNVLPKLASRSWGCAQAEGAFGAYVVPKA